MCVSRNFRNFRLIEARERAGGEGGAGRLRSLYGYDAAGRQVAQSDYDPGGITAVYSRTAQYDTAGRLAADQGYTLRSDGKTATSSTSYGYGSIAGGDYALGAVVTQAGSSYVSGAGGGTSYTGSYTGYLWYDGALQASIQQSNSGAGGNTGWSTALSYDGQGRLTAAQINDGKPHNVAFTNDELGQIVRRDESPVAYQAGAPHEVWYRHEGRQVGYTGNNGTGDLGMTASIADRQQASPGGTQGTGTFRGKQLAGAAHADFAQSYDPLNSYGQGSAGGAYEVRRGDTLPGIARQLWGDANLWYKLAEANGLGANSAPIEGQRLTLPTGVVRTGNTADTARPYNPADAIGDITPGTSAQSAKPRNKKCGAFGAILSTIVAVAASYLLGPVIGNVVSQGFNNLIGTQQGFSWKSLGLSVVAAGATAGLSGAYSGVQSAVVRGALQAATASAVTQGIGVATGLQAKFDFAGVAAAGIGAGLGTGLRQSFAAPSSVGAALAQRLAGYTASGIANAATRSLFNGTSFGDNLIAALPDIIGQTVGGALEDFASGRIGMEVAAGKAIRAERIARQQTAARGPQIAVDRSVFTIDGGVARSGAPLVAVARYLPPAEIAALTEQAKLNALTQTAASKLPTKYRFQDGYNAGELSNYVVPGMREAVRLTGGVLGYYQGQVDGKAYYVRLYAAEAKAAAIIASDVSYVASAYRNEILASIAGGVAGRYVIAPAAKAAAPYVGRAFTAARGTITSGLQSLRRAFAVGPKQGVFQAVETAPSRVLSAVEAGANLVARNGGKNRVSVKTPGGRLNIDLAGEAHFEKSLGVEVPAPHVQFQKLNVGPNGQGRLGPPGPTRPAAMDDIRTARKILERQGQ